MNKNKDILVTGREDQYGFETSRNAGFLDNRLIDGCEFLVLRDGRALHAKNIRGTRFC
jgi:hypothetical protein